MASTVVREVRITAGSRRGCRHVDRHAMVVGAGARTTCAHGARRGAEAGGHHGDADAVFHGVVEHGAVLDEGFGRGEGLRTVFTASRTPDIFSDGWR